MLIRAIAANVISPFIQLLSGTTRCQIPNKNAAVKFAVINGLVFERILINSPRKTPSSIHTLMILKSRHRAKKTRPVFFI